MTPIDPTAAAAQLAAAADAPPVPEPELTPEEAEALDAAVAADVEPEPQPEPVAPIAEPGDASAAADSDASPASPSPGKSGTNYKMLWTTADALPAWTEGPWIVAREPQQAKEAWLNDPQFGAAPLNAAKGDGGVLLRAIPQRSWPEAEATTLHTPAPVLEIR